MEVNYISMDLESKEKRGCNLGFRLFQLLIYSCILMPIILIAYLFDALIESSIALITFFTLRYCFAKTYHCSTTLNCILISILIFAVISINSIPINISLFSNILISFVLTLVLFLLKDYIDLSLKLKNKPIKSVYKDMTKDEMNEVIKDIGLNHLEETILIDFYCNKLSLTIISNQIGYTYQYTHDLKSKALSKIHNFYK